MCKLSPAKQGENLILPAPGAVTGTIFGRVRIVSRTLVQAAVAVRHIRKASSRMTRSVRQDVRSLDIESALEGGMNGQESLG